jgi:hypothetical protein
VNDIPTEIQLSNQTIDERVVQGTLVGVLSATDGDLDDTFSYSLVAGVLDDDNGDFLISEGTLITNAEFDFEAKSIYLIRVQVSDGVDVFSQPFAITVNDVDETGVEEYSNQLPFNVYPVPADNELTIEFENPEHLELLLEIYSNTGSIVHAEHISTSTTIDVSDYKGGMYILIIKGENVFGTRKIIVKN